MDAAPEVTVNGTVVRKTALFDGDRIRTGPYEFRLHVRWPGTADRDRRRIAPPQSEDALVESRRLVADVRAAMAINPEGARLRLFTTDEPSFGDRRGSSEKEGVSRSPTAAPGFGANHDRSTASRANSAKG